MRPLLLTAFSCVLSCQLMAHAYAQGDWQFTTVASGTKPSLDLDSQGNPHIAYMYEIPTGWVRYASWNAATQDFDTATVNDGNFYGPPSIAMDQNDVPGINYHRHTPPPEQIYATRVGSTWINTDITSDNHDGWDNSLQFDSNNLPHTSSIDPIDFGGTSSTGIEYASFGGASWSVEPIGSAQIHYFTGTSLELDAGDNPHITYFDSNDDDLMYAVKSGGSWDISPVDTEGNVGRFSSLELDAAGNPHVSYYRHLVDSTGVVKYASWNGFSWVIEVVDTLRRVYLDGARTITSLDLDEDDTPHISYGDEKRLMYATRDGSGWSRETIIDVNQETTLLGQVNSIGVSASGQIHIAYYILLTRNPLTGTVMHVTKGPAGIPCGDLTSMIARCVGRGTIQTRVTLLNSTIHEGKIVQFQVDQNVYPATVISNGTHSRAQISEGGFSAGPHTITLIEPPGCFGPRVITCTGESGSPDEWDRDETLWGNTGSARISEED